MALLFQRSFIGSLHYLTSEWPETAFCPPPQRVARPQKLASEGFWRDDENVHLSRRQTKKGSQPIPEGPGTLFGVIGVAGDPALTSHARDECKTAVKSSAVSTGVDFNLSH